MGYKRGTPYFRKYPNVNKASVRVGSFRFPGTYSGTIPVHAGRCGLRFGSVRGSPSPSGPSSPGAGGAGVPGGSVQVCGSVRGFPEMYPGLT